MPGNAGNVGVLRVDLELLTAAFEAPLKKATAALNSNVAQMKRSLNTIQKSMDSVTRAAGLVQGAVAAWAGSQVVGAIMQTVKAYGEAEKSVVSLNAVLQATGRFSESASDGIQKSAQALSRLTTFDDDDIVAATATFGQFAKKLTGPELAQGQKAIVGLAAVMHTDLDTAAKQLGKTVSGASDSIGRTGITISKTKDESQRLNEVIAKTNSFLAQAQAETQTLDGRVQQANVSWGNFQEAIGGVIADGVGLNQMLGDTKSNLDKSTDAINQNHESLARWVAFFKACGTLVLNTANMIVLSVATLISGTVFGISNLVSGALNEVNRMIIHITSLLNQFSSNVINPLLGNVNKFTGGMLGGFQIPAFKAPQIPRGGLKSVESSAFDLTKMLGGALKSSASNLFSDFPRVFSTKPLTGNTPIGGSGMNGEDEGSGGKGGGKSGSGHKDKSAAQKQLEDLKSFAASVKESIRSAFQQLTDYEDKLDAAAKKGFLTAADKAKAMTEKADQLFHDQADVSKNVEVAMGKLIEPHKKFLDDFKTSLSDATDDTAFQEALRIREEVMTSEEKLIQNQDYLNSLFRQGAIDGETYSRAWAKLTEDFNNSNQSAQQFSQSIQNVISQFGDQFFNTVIKGSKDGKVAFSDFVASALQDLSKLIFKLTVTIPLANALTYALTGKKAQNSSPLVGILGKIAGSFAGSLFGSGGAAKPIGPIVTPNPAISGFASGGDPPVGKPSIVGENGWELFVPKTAGTIYNQQQLAGMGGGQSIAVYQTFNVSTGVVPTVRAEIARMMPEISRQTQKDVRTAIAKGGPMARAVGVTT